MEGLPAVGLAKAGSTDYRLTENPVPTCGPRSASRPGRETVLAAGLRFVLAGAGRARPVIVELDHARQLGQGDLTVSVRISAVITRKRHER